MKGVFWSKLSSQQCSKSLFWSSITLKQLDHLEIDYSLLEESFSDQKLPVLTTALSSPSVLCDKPKTITLFDSRRTQNILISLNKLKVTAVECVEMICELDPLVLTCERCELLSTLVPTSEESKQLIACSAEDLPLLAKAEQFLYQLNGLYRLKERLECHQLIFGWNAAADGLTGEINILHSACQELLSNESKTKLQTIFSVILAIGNYMNGGTSRVATGITLDSIVKMSTVKATKETSNALMKKSDSLLHYVVRQLESRYRDTLTFYADWRCVLTASDISFTQLLSEISRLQKELNQIQSEMESLSRHKSQLLQGPSVPPDDPSAVLRLIEKAEDRFQPFVSQATNLLKYIRTNLSSMESVLQSTMEIFGENWTTADSAGVGGSGDDKCQQFFKVLCQVMNLFQKIEQENQQSDLARQKLAAKVAAAAAAVGKGKQSRISAVVGAEEGQQHHAEAAKKGPQDNLFDNFRSNEEESPEKIVELFRSKLPNRRCSAFS
jgi:hypothetical protein